MRTRVLSSMSTVGGSHSFSAILMVLCTWRRVREVDPQGHQGADAWPHRVKGSKDTSASD